MWKIVTLMVVRGVTLMGVERLCFLALSTDDVYE